MECRPRLSDEALREIKGRQDGPGSSPPTKKGATLRARGTPRRPPTAREEEEDAPRQAWAAVSRNSPRRPGWTVYDPSDPERSRSVKYHALNGKVNEEPV